MLLLLVKWSISSLTYRTYLYFEKKRTRIFNHKNCSLSHQSVHVADEDRRNLSHFPLLLLGGFSRTRFATKPFPCNTVSVGVFGTGSRSVTHPPKHAMRLSFRMVFCKYSSGTESFDVGHCTRSRPKLYAQSRSA